MLAFQLDLRTAVSAEAPSHAAFARLVETESSWMLTRRFELSHPQGLKHPLPLLVPSFSTKGFGFRTTKKGTARREYSEVVVELEDFANYPSSSVLVSGYDLHFQHFSGPKKLTPDRYLRNSALVFIDSGGYELISDFDSTELRPFGYVPKEGYGLKQYLAVVDALTTLKKPLPLVIANFDHGTTRRPLAEQIRSARAIFAKYPNCATSLILRPWTKKYDYVDPRSLSDNEVGSLRGFSIVGIPEKDLGRNLMERLGRVAILRRRLNQAGISSPIQVWGGLDPLTTPLFFFAGAEIFDGVSWLRYAYTRGVAINRESYPVLSSMGITASRTLNHASANMDNKAVLNKLTIALQQWVDLDGEAFDMFDPSVSKHLEEAYKVMRTQIPELKDGA